MVDAELLSGAAEALEALTQGRLPNRLQCLSSAFALDTLSHETVADRALSRDLAEAAQGLYRIARGGCWKIGAVERPRVNALAVAVREFIELGGWKPIGPQKIEMTLQVGNQVQADELRAAWHEIVSGQKLTHAEAREQGIESIMERARPALEIIETAIRQNQTTGQAGRLVRFLAAIYNGYDYSFDLTELRALDTRLANACLDYLNYDRLGKREVHRHLSGGDRELHRWIEACHVPPRIQLDSRDEQAARLLALVKRTDRHPSEFAREAFNLVLQKHEGHEFGSVVSRRAEQNRRASNVPPVRHARRVSDATEAPLCGAQGSPWRAGPFDFGTLTCQACKDIVLGYEPSE
jgi:hypothetical protein